MCARCMGTESTIFVVFTLLWILIPLCTALLSFWDGFSRVLGGLAYIASRHMHLGPLLLRACDGSEISNHVGSPQASGNPGSLTPSRRLDRSPIQTNRSHSPQAHVPGTAGRENKTRVQSDVWHTGSWTCPQPDGSSLTVAAMRVE